MNPGVTPFGAPFKRGDDFKPCFSTPPREVNPEVMMRLTTLFDQALHAVGKGGSRPVGRDAPLPSPLHFGTPQLSHPAVNVPGEIAAMALHNSAARISGAPGCSQRPWPTGSGRDGTTARSNGADGREQVDDFRKVDARGLADGLQTLYIVAARVGGAPGRSQQPAPSSSGLMEDAVGSNAANDLQQVPESGNIARGAAPDAPVMEGHVALFDKFLCPKRPSCPRDKKKLRHVLNDGCTLVTGKAGFDLAITPSRDALGDELRGLFAMSIGALPGSAKVSATSTKLKSEWKCRVRFNAGSLLTVRMPKSYLKDLAPAEQAALQAAEEQQLNALAAACAASALEDRSMEWECTGSRQVANSASFGVVVPEGSAEARLLSIQLYRLVWLLYHGVCTVVQLIRANGVHSYLAVRPLTAAGQWLPVSLPEVAAEEMDEHEA